MAITWNPKVIPSLRSNAAAGASNMHTGYQSSAQAPTPVEAAAARQCEVRYPASNELFIDIDSERDFERFKVLLGMFERFYKVRGWRATPSASGLPHRHVVVEVGGNVTAFERIAMQAMLGSDLKREMLSFERHLEDNPNPTVFFEPLPGVKPVAKATGHNCRVCNQRNDFAEANQVDGTYVCFNCRVPEDF